MLLSSTGTYAHPASTVRGVHISCYSTHDSSHIGRWRRKMPVSGVQTIHHELDIAATGRDALQQYRYLSMTAHACVGIGHCGTRCKRPAWEHAHPKWRCPIYDCVRTPTITPGYEPRGAAQMLASIHGCMGACVHACVHKRIHACAHMHHMHIHTHACAWMHTRTHECACMWAHAWMHACTHAPIRPHQPLMQSRIARRGPPRTHAEAGATPHQRHRPRQGAKGTWQSTEQAGGCSANAAGAFVPPREDERLQACQRV